MKNDGMDEMNIREYLENHKNIYYLPIGDGISIALVGY